MGFGMVVGILVCLVFLFREWFVVVLVIGGELFDE